MSVLGDPRGPESPQLLPEHHKPRGARQGQGWCPCHSWHPACLFSTLHVASAARYLDDQAAGPTASHPGFHCLKYPASGKLPTESSPKEPRKPQSRQVARLTARARHPARLPPWSCWTLSGCLAILTSLPGVSAQSTDLDKHWTHIRN